MDQAKPFPERTRFYFVILALTLLALAAYHPVFDFEFVNHDDDRYIVGNPHLTEGLSLRSLAWAFSADLSYDSPYVDYWQPVTLISRLLDHELFGIDGPGSHRVNLILHILNGGLVFIFFQGLTGGFGRSAVLAGLFLIHPLQAEPVAWVTARKDLLAGFFGFLTLIAYRHSLTRGRARPPFLSLLFFLLGLLAKPVLVVLPLVLFLIDRWTLGRISWDLSKGAFLVLAGMAMLVPFVGQTSIVPYSVPVALLMKAPLHYVTYLEKIFVPIGLGVYRPPSVIVIPFWKMLASFFSLALVSLLAIRFAKRFPFWYFGWFWFLIFLAPSLGAERADDRFMYLPLAGIFLIVLWGMGELASRLRISNRLLGLGATLPFLVLTPLAFAQVQHWRNSFALFERSLALDPTNFLAYNQLCVAWYERRELKKAEALCRKGLEVEPRTHTLHYNLGVVLTAQGRSEEAAQAYRRALEIRPDYDQAHANLAVAYTELGESDKALFHFTEAIRYQPLSAEHQYNLREFWSKKEKRFA